jgi:hypothetical protein
MRRHATAQLIGDRSHQCDATATRFTPYGECVYVLLDGIGSTGEVQRWTRRQAVRLAAVSTRLSTPTDALRRQRVGNERESWWGGADTWGYGEPPSAVAVAALWADKQLEIAWCGDARAYLLHPDGRLQRLTIDHNARQAALDAGREPLRWDRNLVLSHLLSTDGEVGSVILDVPAGRLLLASDGLYEPIEDAGRSLAYPLARFADPQVAARHLVDLAMRLGEGRRDNATCLVADLAPLAGAS